MISCDLIVLLIKDFIKFGYYKYFNFKENMRSFLIMSILSNTKTLMFTTITKSSIQRSEINILLCWIILGLF